MKAISIWSKFKEKQVRNDIFEPLALTQKLEV